MRGKAVRNLIQLVSLFFILIGIVVVVSVIPPLIERADSLGNLPTALGVVVAALTPGGMIIIFGSVSYMLCSIDMRLEEMLDRPQPKPVQVVASAAAPEPARDHDLF
jgi:predicted membrane channel-forming protein YqfA (hemolysin III family)